MTTRRRRQHVVMDTRTRRVHVAAAERHAVRVELAAAAVLRLPVQRPFTPLPSVADRRQTDRVTTSTRAGLLRCHRSQRVISQVMTSQRKPYYYGHQSILIDRAAVDARVSFLLSSKIPL